MTTVDAIKTEITKKPKPRKKNIKPPEGNHTIIFPEDVVMEHQWKYDGVVLTEIPEKVIGFVYCITNKITNKKYIGKKNMFGTKTRSVKKQKYRERVQSDFVTYYGSNDDLKKDVEENGPDNFTREILVLCESLGEMGYWEAKYQFHYDVTASDRWYNHWICVRVNAKHLKPHHYNHTLRTDL